MIRAATKEGAVDFVSVADGGILMRLVLGKFTIGKITLSSDRKWLAMEQHALVEPNTTGVPSRTFDVGVWDMTTWKQQTTIPSCEQMLNVASGGKVVAVVRDKQIEICDVATAKKLKAAPFKHTRIDATAFSPDGKLFALVDRNELVLWRWEEDAHERIDLG